MLIIERKNAVNVANRPYKNRKNLVICVYYRKVLNESLWVTVHQEVGVASLQCDGEVLEKVFDTQSIVLAPSSRTLACQFL